MSVLRLQVAQDTALRFPERVSISQHEGTNPNCLITPPPEEQRLSQIYNQKGINALIEELKKFQFVRAPSFAKSEGPAASNSKPSRALPRKLSRIDGSSIRGVATS